MNLDDELRKIMDNAWSQVMTEGLAMEMNDFKKIEQNFLDSSTLVAHDTCELWYATKNPKGEAEIVNEQDDHEDALVLGVVHEASYYKVSDMLDDEESFEICKQDGCVAIITRTQMSGRKLANTTINVMVTRRGMHIIIREQDEIVSCETIPKRKIYAADVNYLSALFDACFTW